ncbi:MAG: type II secretion system minor pseudopilin GspH [Betaproteobacteria bacterium]|nr:type II secretion system minor pseudopilin GspH [Betaproteobacteria bacterium]MDE2623000.1 type II secretion system minor pseudopilin GspH [Betaproteobacteria bacterium]
MTQTSATGVREAGFTLIELLVVLVLMGIMLGMVTLSVRSPQNRPLVEEGERLAAVMNLAADEARLTGHPLLLLLDRQGWRFFESGPQGPQPVPDDELPGGRFDPALDGVGLEGGLGGGGESVSRLQYWVGQEAMDNGSLFLQRGNQQARVVSDGLGNYQVGR